MPFLRARRTTTVAYTVSTPVRKLDPKEKNAARSTNPNVPREARTVLAGTYVRGRRLPKGSLVVRALPVPPGRRRRRRVPVRPPSSGARMGTRRAPRRPSSPSLSATRFPAAGRPEFIDESYDDDVAARGPRARVGLVSS